MATIIQKFGGTSVRNSEQIQNAVTKTVAEIEQGHHVVVIVSAMAGTTDWLRDLCLTVQDLTTEGSQAEYDAVVASGEQINAGLFALSLQKLGIPARSFLSWQLPIVTDHTHTQASITSIKTAPLQQALEHGIVPVIAGFQGVSPEERLTTLARGGSDTTAVAVCASLNGHRCDIYTDVNGVYTADPRIVSKAHKINAITYEEMMEMASLGAQVLQTRSVALAMRYRVPIQVLSTFRSEIGSQLSGTLVVEEEKIMEQKIVCGVALNYDEAKMTLLKVADRPGVAATIFDLLVKANVNVDIIVQNISEDGLATDLTFTLSRACVSKAYDALQNARELIGFDRLVYDTNVVKLSVIGIGMKNHVGVARKMFQTLAEKNINIQVISTSEIKISVLIAEEYAELALRSLHTAYGLDQQE